MMNLSNHDPKKQFRSAVTLGSAWVGFQPQTCERTQPRSLEVVTRCSSLLAGNLFVFSEPLSQFHSKIQNG